MSRRLSTLIGCAVAVILLVTPAVATGVQEQGDLVVGEAVISNSARCPDGESIVWGKLLVKIEGHEATAGKPERGTMSFGVVCPLCLPGEWHATSSYAMTGINVSGSVATFGVVGRDGLVMTVVDGGRGIANDGFWCGAYRYDLYDGNLSVMEK